jgi:hypothetical protein
MPIIVDTFYDLESYRTTDALQPGAHSSAATEEIYHPDLHPKKSTLISPTRCSV